jgi:glycosyltransferase involved in cell wall biosynthesis
MMMLLNNILIVISLVLVVPVLVLFLQVILAVIAKNIRASTICLSTPRPSVGILVPAHNEEHGLAKTLNAILPQLNAEDQLVVIADNCDDKTADVAKSLGAITLVRFNKHQRGKGYALDFGMQHLMQKPPEVVIIVDADCEIDNNLIDVISKLCVKLQRPVQANYIMHFPSNKGLKQQVAEFAWIVKNKVRPLGYLFMGLPCQLMGTGMAFLWKDLAKCNLASGHLVEDMKLGLDLAIMGSSPVYCPETNVRSFFPASEEGQATQRARWEHGHLGVIVSEAPKYMMKALLNVNVKMFAQVLDLMVPPLALTFILNLGFWVLAFCFWVYTKHLMPLIIATIILAILFFGILYAWYSFGRKAISLKSLMIAPLVLFMKIPLYIKFIINRQVDWIRSKRDHQ